MFSNVLRRTHMYLALFLMPWMLMYAVSTMAMNHRHSLQKYFGKEPAYEKESVTVFSIQLDASAPEQMTARRILISLGLDGRHSARKSPSGETLTIYRNDPLRPRRITYTYATGSLVIERQVLRAPAFLENMHRRKGFESQFVADDLWALSVDLVIAAMVFWAASGLWMWWEMKAARTWGALATAAGVGLFVMFLILV